MRVVSRLTRLAARTLLAAAAASVLIGDLRPAPVGAQTAPSPIPPPPPNPFAPRPLPLSANPIPKPNDLASYVQDEAAAIRLGKALFWDMQAGGDGVQACASCHFHAGADNRVKNQLNPGLNGGDTTFQLGGHANYTVKPTDHPFHRFQNPDNGGSPLLANFNEVLSSQGVFKTRFVDVMPGSAVDKCVQEPDPTFSVGATKVRRVEPRHTPTVVNAVFNFRNFWDGRAAFFFNGVNPVGPRDPGARVFQVQADGSVLPVAVLIDNGSLASQATGPPGSPFEMSCDGRTFPKIGKKMLSLPPLAKQKVDPTDGVLGALARSGQPGLATTYVQMIRDAFQPQWWNASAVITFPGGVPTVSAPTGSPLTTDQFTVTEANFSLFWGLAIQLYEATLVSDQAPFDRFAAGDGSALSVAAQQGFDIFLNQGDCILCHGGSLFSGATIPEIGVQVPGAERELLVERMLMELGVATGTLTFLRPPVGQPAVQVLTFDPRGVSLTITRGTTCTAPVAFAGTVPGPTGSCAAVLPVLTILTPTNAIPILPATLGSAEFAVGAACVKNLTVRLAAVPAGDYTLCAGGVSQGTFPVVALGATSVGAIAFASSPPPPLPPNQPLDFDPRGSFVSIHLGADCLAQIGFSGTFPGTPAPPCDPAVALDATRLFDATLALAPAPGVALGPFPAATASFTVNPDCSASFVTSLGGVPAGQYTVCTGGIARATMNAFAEAFYDHGFYNIGVRPTPEDLGIGGDAAGPIAFVRRLQLGLPVPELTGIQLPPVILPTDRIAFHGAFKTPILRNVSLTAPYMHNGGMGTLLQVVEFYARGADFFNENLEDLDVLVAGIGFVRGQPARKAALVAFLESLTDDRVRFEKAPFDHPQLLVPNGHPGGPTLVHDDGTGKARDVLLDVPAVGAAGSCIGLDGTRDPSPRVCPVVEAVVEADVSVQQASPDTNFGTATDLQVDGDTPKHAFVRVRVSGVGSRTITNARLRLQVGSATNAPSDSGGRIQKISNCSWDELQATWNTQPALDGALLDAKGSVLAGQTVDFDVTAAMLTDGVYCFALDSLSTDNAIYNSREVPTGKPQLLLTVSGSCDCSIVPPPGCGDNRVNTLTEECDGPADGACPGLCRPDCTCAPPACGDNLVDLPTEQCDGRDDGRCPGFCRPDCTCAPIPPTGVVEADAYVSSASRTTKFGTGLALNARAGSTVQQIFFRVRASGLGAQPPSSARLRLQVSSASGAGSASGGRIHPITNCAWDETTVIWDTRPVIDGAVLSTLGSVARNQVVEFDVVSAITGDGVYCFAVDSLSTDNVIYNAREAAAGRPELLLAVGTGCTPTTCAAQGKNCGTISNGCGGTLTCRSCTAPQTCGGGGVANVCGVVPAAVTVTVLADAAVDSTLPTANLGTAVQLNVDAGPAVKHTFLRVQVSNVAGRVITAARLNLTAATTTNAQSVAGGQIHPVASCTWGETTITWDNQPAIAAGVLSSLGAVAQGQAVSFDLAGAITGDGTYCFAIDSSSTDGVDYNAREASSGRPALVLTTTP